MAKNNPLDIVICIIDKYCPRCEAGTHQTRVTSNGRVSRGDFDIGYEADCSRAGDRAFGARCKWCGWSF